MSRNRRKRKRGLHLQALENRQLMAGDVSVQFSNSDSRDLVITGDNASNRIRIEEIAVDRIRVTGLEGTLINGSSNSASFTVRDDILVNMRGGNDKVTLRNLNQDDDYSHSDVRIDLGEGNDSLDVIAVDVRRNLNVNAGDGRDDIDIIETTARDMAIDGQYGDDTIHLDEVTTRNSVRVDGGEDADTVVVNDSVIRNDLIIDLDAGSDELQVTDVDIQNDLRVDLGAGDDIGYVNESEADDIRILGRTGDDLVSVIDNKVSDQLYVSLSTGDDYLSFQRNTVGRYHFDGGTGDDQWFTVLEYFWTWSNFYNF